MMTDWLIQGPAAWSYFVAACVFLVLSAMHTRNLRAGMHSRILFTALVSSTVWALLCAFSSAKSASEIWDLARLADTVRVFFWLSFLAAVSTGHGSSAPPSGARRKYWILLVPVSILSAATLYGPTYPPLQDVHLASIAPLLAQLGCAVIGLALSELIFRQTPGKRWWSIKPFWIGITGMFAFDLVFLATAVLTHTIDRDFWVARGFVAAFAAIIISVATSRTAGWRQGLALSRGAALQFTSLAIAGTLLLIISAAGYWVRQFGGAWGGPLAVATYFVAFMAMAVLLLSGRLRSELRVWIARNLFSRRYDHREEWLRFTNQIAASDPMESSNQKIIRAIADLVESPGGSLWLDRDGLYRQVAVLDSVATDSTIDRDCALIRHCAEIQRVIDLVEYRADPQKRGLIVNQNCLENPRFRFVIPLLASGSPIGLVLLDEPRAPLELDWEVSDILKTAAAQAATHLAEVHAREALVEVQKLDAFNRMSAFVVHDLKNLIAQLDLLVRNAERHRQDPEFQADMLDTIRHAVGRMQQLMLQLRSGTIPAESARKVDFAKIAQRVVEEKRHGGIAINLVCDPSVPVTAHKDRLERVLGHILQNGIESQGTNSATIDVRVWRDGMVGVAEVSDAGIGMSEQFIKERLFRPFQTTKEHGMGIGMFESQQYLAGIGGSIAVVSAPDAGTRVRITVPCTSD